MDLLCDKYRPKPFLYIISFNVSQQPSEEASIF